MAKTKRTQPYYLRAWRGGKRLLAHRIIWEEHHGPIPDGHLIHHIDGNPRNNTLENLQCLKGRKEHLENHMDLTEKKCAYCDAPFTDRSMDGRGTFCSRKCKVDSRHHQEKQRRGFKPVEKICACGKTFLDRSARQHGRFCSDNCRRRQARGFKPVEKICECGSTFIDRSSHQWGRFCSPKCRQAAYNRRRRELRRAH